MVVAGLTVLGVGALFALLPVPAQTISILGTNDPYFCGPGNSSEPAIVVWQNPSSTTSGTGSGSFDQSVQALGESACLAAAQERLFIALGLGIVGALLAAAGPRTVRYVLYGKAPVPPALPQPPHEPGAEPQGWWRRHWLMVVGPVAGSAIVAVPLAVLTLTGSGTPSSEPNATGTSVTPTTTPGLSSCDLAYAGHDARVSFSGASAIQMCNSWESNDGNWTAAAGTPAYDTVTCSDSYEGTAWRVVDDGGMLYGGEACSALNAWAHGGNLRVP